MEISRQSQAFSYRMAALTHSDPDYYTPDHDHLSPQDMKDEGLHEPNPEWYGESTPDGYGMNIQNFIDPSLPADQHDGFGFGGYDDYDHDTNRWDAEHDELENRHKVAWGDHTPLPPSQKDAPPDPIRNDDVKIMKDEESGLGYDAIVKWNPEHNSYDVIKPLGYIQNLGWND